MEKEKFNQSKYIQEWNKQNKRQFKVQFVRNALNDLKNKSN